jgi:hypothetical protein
VDASALDLEMLPQLDPLSIEHMIDAPTPGGLVHSHGSLSQGMDGLPANSLGSL